MKNSKTLIFSSLFFAIALISFSSFTNFQNLKSYQEEIKPFSDSITYTILLGGLKSGSYDTSKILEQKEIRVNATVGGKTIENYLRVTRYTALLVPKEDKKKARLIPSSTNKMDAVSRILNQSKSGDKLIISEVVGHDAKGYEKKPKGSLIITLK